MINDTTKSLRPLYTIIMLLTGFIVFFDYAIRLQFIHLQYTKIDFENFNILNLLANQILTFIKNPNYKNIMIGIRIVSIVFVYQFWIVQGNYIKNLNIWKKYKTYHIILLITGISIYILGYYKISNINYIIIPIGYLLIQKSMLFLVKSKQDLKTNNNPLDEIPKGKKDKYTLTLKTEKGDLNIFNPFTGIGVIGQPGSGKSYFILTQIHYQCILNGFTAYIYDYKGNPPTLGKDIYNIVYHLNKKGHKTPKFQIFNPAEPIRSVRINLLNPKLIKSKFDAQTIALVIYNNLDKESIKKTDFWAKNALNILENIIYTNAIYNPQFSTIPHMIALILRPIEELCKYLIYIEKKATNNLNTNKTTMIEKNMLAVIDAYKKQADSQLAGVIATTALPLAGLNTKEIFYLLSENEMDLDISNPKNPTIFVACTDPKNDRALQPIHGLLSSTIMRLTNQQGNEPFLFSVDELPTQFILNLDKLPATGKSNKIITCTTFQSKKQLEETYGKTLADVTWECFGNQIYLVNKDTATSKILSTIAGKHDVNKTSSSINTTEGNLTTSHSTQKEEVLPIEKILQQKTGHAYGIISDTTTDNPLFGAQIIGTTTAQLLEIPNKEIKEIPNYYDDTVTEEILNDKMTQTFNEIHDTVDEFFKEIPEEMVI